MISDEKLTELGATLRNGATTLHVQAMRRKNE
jgi:hypothetical protein